MNRSMPYGYSVLRKIIHWFMAAAIIGMLFIGLISTASIDALRLELLDWHRSLGALLLMIAVARIVLNFIQPADPNSSLTPYEHYISGSVHLMLYFLMIAMPLLGWAMMSAGSYPVSVFGGVMLPDIVPASGPLHSVLRRFHTVGAVLFVGLISIHFGAAMFHALIRDDGTLKRMLPWP